MTRCQRNGCGLWTTEGMLCERCQRLMAIGALVIAVDQAATGESDLRVGLNAIAHLLTDHARMRRAYQAQLREADRETAAAARDGYAAGLFEGIDQRNRG